MTEGGAIDLPGDRDPRTGYFLPGNAVARRSQSRQVQLMREALESHRQALIDRVLAVAAGPDATAAIRAAVWALERLGGPIEAQTTLPPISGLAEARSPADKARCIVAAVAAGVISVEAADKVLAAIQRAVAVVQASELEERVRALEQSREAKTIDLRSNDDDLEDLG